MSDRTCLISVTAEKCNVCRTFDTRKEEIFSFYRSKGVEIIECKSKKIEKFPEYGGNSGVPECLRYILKFFPTLVLIPEELLESKDKQRILNNARVFGAELNITKGCFEHRGSKSIRDINNHKAFYESYLNLIPTITPITEDDSFVDDGTNTCPMNKFRSNYR